MTKNQLSKTCINCNLQKPLTAYLQITGPQGSSYGNICSTCRGSGLAKKVTLPVNEDTGSSSSTGLKIDAKAKVHADLEKKAVLEKRHDEDKKEREKLDLKNEDLENRKILKQELEDKHRKEFIEPNKAKSFLDYQSKKPEDKRVQIERRAMDEVMQHDAEAKEDLRVRSFDDLTVTRHDPTQANTKLASAEWKKFRALLGGSAAFNVVEQQLHTEQTRHDTLLEPSEYDAKTPGTALNPKQAPQTIKSPDPQQVKVVPQQQPNVQDNKPVNAPQAQPANAVQQPPQQPKNAAKPEVALNFGMSKRDALLNYTQKNFENEKPAPTSPSSPGSRRR